MALVRSSLPMASPLVVLALLSPLAAALLDAASAQRVDCRKFVFAPSCRGVAAKRTTVKVGVTPAEYDAEALSSTTSDDDAAILFSDEDLEETPRLQRRSRPPVARRTPVAPESVLAAAADEDEGEGGEYEEGETAEEGYSGGGVGQRGRGTQARGGAMGSRRRMRKAMSDADWTHRHKATVARSPPATSDWLIGSDAHGTRSRTGSRRRSSKALDYDY